MKNKYYSTIEPALVLGGKLHGFSSGGGLRILDIDRDQDGFVIYGQLNSYQQAGQFKLRCSSNLVAVILGEVSQNRLPFPFWDNHVAIVARLDSVSRPALLLDAVKEDESAAIVVDEFKPSFIAEGQCLDLLVLGRFVLDL